MDIHFSIIRWKNLLSTGNKFIELKLDSNKNTLIMGENGSGKSTFLDALTFCLFGKSFRNINKPTLVNSINQKNLVVEVEFTINNKDQYKIIRGLKPNIFEIYCNGTLINQDAASRDYQEFLEKNILKTNYKSFTQIVILGSASFIPFMQLKAADRRSIIEDLLDIQIFSSMNVIAKQLYQKNTTEIDSLKSQITSLIGNRNVLKDTVKALKTQKDKDISENEQKINEASVIYSKMLADHVLLSNEMKNMLTATVKETLNEYRKYLHELVKTEAQLENEKSSIVQSLKFYSENDTCPTCAQQLDKQLKTEKIAHNLFLCEEIGTKLSTIESQMNNTKIMINSEELALNQYNEIMTKKKVLETEIREQFKYIEKLQEENNFKFDEIYKDNVKKLKLVLKDIEEKENQLESLINDRLYIETSINLLKDGGIKTKIIKQYTPIINKQIKSYLKKMGFLINFELTDNFEEYVSSQYISNDFSYENFSEGEKSRIDLAILFTWRSIAKMKNSFNTNLLIMDEVFDSSLDVTGTDDLLKIINALTKDTNVFIISHKTESLYDKFEKVFRFEKRKNFSMMIEDK